MADEGLRGKSELTQRVISAIILAAGAIFAAWMGGWLFAAVWTALAVAVAYEWARICAPERANPCGRRGCGARFVSLTMPG